MIGRIDVLCNIAGGFRMGEAVHETSDETWDFLFDLNARSLLHTVRAVVPRMLTAGGGKIVNVGAFAAQKGVAGMGAYCASKSAVIRLTEAMAAELREKPHQRQLRPADHHRHAGEPFGDAGRQSVPLGIAGRSRQRGPVPEFESGARRPWRRSAGHRPELKRWKDFAL